MSTASELQAANDMLTAAAKGALAAVVPQLQTALDTVNSQANDIGTQAPPSPLSTISGYLDRCKANIQAFIDEGTYLLGQFPTEQVPSE